MKFSDRHRFSMFLVRPRPFAGESLSSWRQRSGLQNGYKIFPLAPGETRHSDPDLSPSPGTVVWLADQHGLDVNAVQALSLRSLDKTLLQFGVGRATPRWVIPLHQSRRDQSFGVPFCPTCLASDKEPFFRLNWRLAIQTVCEVHLTRLIDRCEKCGHPGWPASVPIPHLYQGPQHQLNICPLCAADLRSSKGGTINFDDVYVDVFSSASSIDLGSMSVPKVEFAAALWATAQLFLRKRSQLRIARQKSAAGAVAAAFVGRRIRSFESLPIERIHSLISTSRALLLNWPASFISFCDAHDISAEHFSEHRESLPKWFGDVVSSRIARQNRGVGLPDVLEAVRKVQMQGRRVTKDAVGEMLGSTGSKSILVVLGRRTSATLLETSQCVQAMQFYMKVDCARRSSLEVRVRNVLVNLLAMLTNKSTQDVLCLNESKAIAAIKSVGELDFANRVHREAIRTLIKASKKYKRIRSKISMKRGEQPSDLYFVSFRSQSTNKRAVQETLRDCMRGIDSRLPRNTGVFLFSPSRDEKATSDDMSGSRTLAGSY